MNIISADKGHAKEILSLLSQLLEVAHGEGDIPPSQVEDNLSQILDNPAYLILLAEEEGNIVGLINVHFRNTLFHPGPSALIDELVVDTRFRGRGIGTALIESAIEEAKRRGCVEIEISTESDNTSAIEFYKKRGFTHSAVLLENEFE